MNETPDPLPNEETPQDTPAKKPFVEPVVSAPQDVLEATTSFLLATPGVSTSTVT